MSPDITAITTVYNCENYLEESIKSILNQTYKNFEFIIVNDGSSDRTGEIINEYAKKDERIIVIDCSGNLGRVRSLNLALERASGKYIAIQDADDISLPERFEVQHKFLKDNPEYVLVGSDITETDESGNFISNPIRPEKDAEIKFSLLFRCTLANPSIMYKRKVLDDNRLIYEERFVHAEDFRIISLISRYGKVYNLPQKLILYRRHERNNSSVNSGILHKGSIEIVKENLLKLGFSVSDEQISRIRGLISSKGMSKEYLSKDIKLLLNIIKKFQKGNKTGKNREVLKTLSRMTGWLGRKDIISRPGHMALQIYILTYFFKQVNFTK